jgi:hypothetical protein
MMLTKFTGGNYNPNQSFYADRMMPGQDSWSDPWTPTGFSPRVSGYVYNDSISLGDWGWHVHQAIVAAETWEVDLPDGTNYTSRFGYLGLGHYRGSLPNPYGSSILAQFKSRGLIKSASWGLHIGSVLLKQPGSLVLGGYEQNRALGDVGVFHIDEWDRPMIFLLDLSLGVETGGSPFDTNKQLGSVWQGLGGSKLGEQATKDNGGIKGSALFMANPAVPYIYLPPGNCEAIAEYLPVTWRKEFGLYAWNTDDAQYKRIINSPAYLAFTFADRTATNLTIKVPFRLLDLILEKPIAKTPTKYFPCRPVNDTDWWMLGRAFLQGAFLGVNFEKDLVYLAQAPGPDMEQSVVRTHEIDDTSIMTNPAKSFEKTWRSTWTIIEDEKQENNTHENGKNNHPKDMSAGAIAGIVVGGVAFIAIALAAFMFWRRRRAGKVTATNGLTTQKQGTPEAPGGELPHEFFSPTKIHEAPGEELHHELEGVLSVKGGSLKES